MSNIHLWAPLRKIEDEDDDTLRVSGYASSEAIDSSGEVVTASAIKDALPEFFKLGGTGPLREMHGLVAAGVVLEAEIDDANRTVIVAKVVDASTIRKIKAGVLKGFSIGGKTLERDPKNRKTITKIRLDEISLVDKPANPEAILDVWKAAGTDGYRGIIAPAKPADPFLAKADALLAKVANAMDPKAAPVEEDLRDPLAKANAAVDALAKAVASTEDFDRRLTILEAAK
jgi:hypothetical protein